MGFFRREGRDGASELGSRAGVGWRTARGMVTEAIAPPQNSQALTQPQEVVVDIGDGPTLFRPQCKIDREFWLVNGMEVTVTFDPSATDAATHSMEVVGDFPSIDARLAAQDPILVDPWTARRTVSAAISSSWATKRREMGIEPASAPGVDPGTEAAFHAELARIAADPLVGQRRRGLAVVISRREWWSPQDRYGNIWSRDERKTNHTGGDTILAVSIPGDRPYATLVELLKFPKHKQHDAPWLPVRVSATDRGNVEIIWDQVDDRATLRETIAEVRADRAADREQVQQALTEQQRAVGDRVAERAPIDPGAATTLADAYRTMAHQQAAEIRALAPQQAEALLANLRLTVSRLQPPSSDAYRDALIAVGLDI